MTRIFCRHLILLQSSSRIRGSIVLTPLRGDSGKSFSAASHEATPRRLTFGSAVAVHPGSLAEKLSPLVFTTLRSIENYSRFNNARGIRRLFSNRRA